MLTNDLRNLSNTLYVVDKNYSIVDYNDGYTAFAMANDGQDIFEKWPLGANILSAVPEVLRDVIKKMYDDVFFNNAVIEHTYDCHSPTVFRRFKMRILPYMNDFALHEHCKIESSSLTGAHDIADDTIRAEYIDQHGMIHQCCHCRRIQSCTDTQNWVWVVALIRRNNVFLSQISHTICPVCLLHYFPED